MWLLVSLAYDIINIPQDLQGQYIITSRYCIVLHFVSGKAYASLIEFDEM